MLDRINALIDQRVMFEKTWSNGFKSIKCPICHDYKPRMGIKRDADSIFVNCFNCGFHASFTDRLTKRFKSFLLAIGCTEDDIMSLEAEMFFNPRQLVAVRREEGPRVPKPVELPPESELIWESRDEWAEVAKAYLAARLPGVDLSSKKIYVSRRQPGFIIFPFYMSGRLVYWQARNLDQASRQRWLNCPVERTSIMYNLDANQLKPVVYLTEGIFDALAVDGIALLGSTLNREKIQLLNQLRGDKIFLFQHDKKSRELAQAVIDLGWKISTVSTDVKDVAESVERYGLLWTLADIKRHVCAGLEARLKVSLT